MKKLETCPAPRNSDSVKEQRRDYARWSFEFAKQAESISMNPDLTYGYKEHGDALLKVNVQSELCLARKVKT